MKKQIITFFIGLLVGAIISTGSILVYSVVTNSNNNSNTIQTMQAPSENDQGMMNTQGSTPPDMQSNSENTTQNS